MSPMQFLHERILGLARFQIRPSRECNKQRKNEFSPKSGLMEMYDSFIYGPWTNVSEFNP